MPAIKTASGVESAPCVSISHLAYTVASALATGMPLSQIEELLQVPPHFEGHFSLSLAHSETFPPTTTLHIQTSTSTYSTPLCPTTGLPTGNIDYEHVTVHPIGIAHPLFRLKPLVLTLNGQELLKMPTSLLSAETRTLAPDQQRLLLRALIPDLPATAPFFTYRPELRIAFHSSMSLEAVPTSEGTPEWHVYGRLTVFAHPNKPNAPWNSCTLLSIKGAPLSARTPPLAVDLATLPFSAFQANVCTLSWLQEVLSTSSEWQPIIQNGRAPDQCSARLLQKHEETATSLIAHWRSIALKPTMDLNLKTTSYQLVPTPYLRLADPSLKASNHALTDASYPSQLYQNYRTGLYHQYRQWADNEQLKRLSC